MTLWTMHQGIANTDTMINMLVFCKSVSKKFFTLNASLCKNGHTITVPEIAEKSEVEHDNYSAKFIND